MTCRAQWSKDLNHRSGSPEEVRSEEDLESYQEEVWYVTTRRVWRFRLRVIYRADSGIACNGTIVNDTEMGEVIQLQGDQRLNLGRGT
jgi:translation initiation factor 1 (eIF-1/SUI1)